MAEAIDQRLYSRTSIHIPHHCAEILAEYDRFVKSEDNVLLCWNSVNRRPEFVTHYLLYDINEC